MSKIKLSGAFIKDRVKLALAEDLYPNGDITTDLLNKNEIIVGAKDELLKKEILLKDINFLVNKEFFNNEIFVKVRSTGKLLRSKLNINNGSTKLILLEDEYGISPGQACVFYSKDELGDKVLGGGWITKN